MRLIKICLLFLIFTVPTAAQDFRGGQRAAESPAVVTRHGMVVAQEALAARIGADILQRGGNAVDAAVATGFAMAVTYPRAGNLGGGGFMVIHLAKGQRDISIDYRETAPAGARPDMFLGPDGKPDPAKSRDSALAVGVPGTVAGLALAHQRYGSGKFSLAQLIEPAIALAEDGFIVRDDLADTLPEWRDRLARWPATAKIFLHPDGSALREGNRLIQHDLARVLRRIAHYGAKGFYRGPTALAIARAIQAEGGIMTARDLAHYRPIVRKPIRGTYRGYNIVSMPPPSSGGIGIVEMLNILEGFDLSTAKPGEAAHLLVESMKLAYADRARFLGDPRYVKVPVKRLTDKAYAARLRATIDLDHARPSASILKAPPAAHEGQNTTHFSVADRYGNAVSNTYTLNFSYGLGLVADGTGILLNNELDDFTAAVGANNAYGLVGFKANLPGPNKRPLSSMTPTIVLKDGKPFLVTGSPGGSRIISATLQVVVNVIDLGMTIDQAVGAPRLHHQWLPDEVRVEHGFPPAIIESLKARGHRVEMPLGQTSANSILLKDGRFFGGPDPRTRGSLAAGD